MLMFQNERFLADQQLLKVLTLAPEMGASSVSGARPQDLRVQFLLRDQEGASRPLKNARVLNTADFAHLRVPFGYGEFSLNGMAPGPYTLEATLGSEMVGQSEVLIFNSKQLEGVVAQMAGEKNTTRARLESTEAFQQIWEGAWQDVYAALNIRIPQHIFPSIQPIQVSGEVSAALWRETLRWVLFHVNRMVFDQIFFGGTAAFSQDPKDPLRFRYTVQSRIPAQPSSSAFHLNQLRQLIKDVDYSVTLEWQLGERTQVFQQRATLDMVWRRGG